METQERKQYRSLQDIFRSKDFSSLYGNGYSDELIDKIVERLKTHSSMNKLMRNVVIDMQFCDLLCSETLFIDDIAKKCNKALSKSHRIYNALYCILNGIAQPPKCQVCGKTNERFLFRWKDHIHIQYCSGKCALAANKKQILKQINDDNRYVFSSNDIEKFHPQLVQLVHSSPRSYFNIIMNSKNRDFAKFVFAYTSFIDYDCNFATRCRYVLDKRQTLYTCHKCGKPIRKQLKCTEHQEKFWCSSKCLSEDKYMNDKIALSNSLAHKGKPKKCSAILPPECKIIYRNTPIQYEISKNNQIYELFLQHQKTFSHWLKRDKHLYDYFMDATYPIDYTNLHFGTRLYWLMHQFQEFPRCKTCGRQLDFKNVKMSHDWPSTCCTKCAIEQIGKQTMLRHRMDMYDKMLQQPDIEVLYSREFFIEVGIGYSKFHVKCKKCGHDFYQPWNSNFYHRTKSGNMFRCPYCYPSKRFRSKGEKAICAFIKDELGFDVQINNRQLIFPYELDIYVPSEKVAIEFNGIKYHSLENNKPFDYHLNKTISCEKLGIKLLHIWEDEWNYDKQLIKQKIADVLNSSFEILGEQIDDMHIKVDRSQYNQVCFKKSQYVIEREEPPVVIQRPIQKQGGFKFNVVNCGYFICVKQTSI